MESLLLWILFWSPAMFQNQTLRKKKELGSYLNHPANIVSSIQNEKTYEIRSGIQRQPILELSLYSLVYYFKIPLYIALMFIIQTSLKVFSPQAWAKFLNNRNGKLCWCKEAIPNSPSNISLSSSFINDPFSSIQLCWEASATDELTLHI